VPCRERGRREWRKIFTFRANWLNITCKRRNWKTTRNANKTQNLEAANAIEKRVERRPKRHTEKYKKAFKAGQ
jgi:hypothetical protein